MKRDSEFFFNKLSSYMLECELENVKTAYIFSKHAHRGQQRDDGQRYFDHPKEVARIVFEEYGINDWKFICAALLHDVLEDTYMLSEHRLILNFGEDVCRWVKLMSKTENFNHYQYVDRLMNCGDWRPIFIKLVDRLHNNRTLQNCEQDKIVRKSHETKLSYYDLADRMVNLSKTRVTMKLKSELITMNERIINELQASSIKVPKG